MLTADRIREAVADERLTLHSQPIVDLASRDVVGHELLLRLREGSESLPAAGFIPAAEEAGIVGELDRLVVARALELAAGPLGIHGHRIHVNISGASFTDMEILEFVEEQLDGSEADPSRITFEITGTTAITNLAAAAHFADRLCEFGAHVAIDDCGAGVGPFRYLKHLPFDTLKIDGEFVRDLLRNDTDRLTVGAIVRIAEELGSITIAGSVQDEETALVLESLGVDMAQGFHFGPPEPLPGGLRSSALA